MIKKILLFTIFVGMMCGNSSFARLTINWFASGGFYFDANSSQGILGAVGSGLPQSTLAQLLWSPDASVSQADASTMGFVSGGEIVLAEFNPVYNAGDPDSAFAFWSSANGVEYTTNEDSNPGVLPATWDTGYIYARIFQSATPVVGERYYAGPVAVISGSGYTWPTGNPQTVPGDYNMNYGEGTFGDDAIDGTYSFQVVPEPGTIGLLALGIMTLGGAAHKKRKAAVVEA